MTKHKIVTSTMYVENQGDDAIHLFEMIYCCPCCEMTHSVNSDCKQGQKA